MGDVLQTGVGDVVMIKQSGKGAVADFSTTARPADRPKLDDGVLDVNKTVATADYVNGLVFGSPQTYTQSVGGEVGNLSTQVEPGNCGIYLAQVLASDIVTGSGSDYTHTMTSSSTAQQPWLAFLQTVGGSGLQKRQVFADCKIGALTLSSTQGDGVLKQDIKVNSLHAGTVATAAAARAENGEDSLLHTESAGFVSLDSTVVCEVSEMAITIDRKQTIFWGNDIRGCQIVDGDCDIVASVKSIVTSDTLPIINKMVYGTATPAAGAEPVKDVFKVPVTRKWQRSATRSLQIDTPAVACNPADVQFGPKKDGGVSEVTFGGQVLKSGSTPALTAIAKTGDSVAYV